MNDESLRANGDTTCPTIQLTTNEDWSFSHLQNVRMLGIDIGGSLVNLFCLTILLLFFKVFL